MPLRGLPSLLTAEKSFADPWVGHRTLNRLGLHPARMVVSDWVASLRRAQLGALRGDAVLHTLRRDGVAAVPELLPPAQFELLRREVRRRVDVLFEAHPPPPADRGFGPQRPFAGGFDRYDGGSLNRFIDIEVATTPNAHALLSNRRFRHLCQAASGQRFRHRKVWIYVLRHGDQKTNPDLQRQLHRDTFHSAVKLWYFLDDVELEHGPFEYVIGSHRPSPARYRWEYQKALAAAAPGAKRRGGAFRIREAELPALGLPPPTPFTVQKNTLVIADVRGFHRRGLAPAGAERLSLYASFRPTPFVPIAY